MEDAVRRECRAVRTAVAVMDVSTLGKIDVRGPDAVWFLEQLYVNAIGTLPVGKARYGVMCRLDGSILDDGVVMRTANDRFFITASTGHAGAVVDWICGFRHSGPAMRLRDLMTEQLSTVDGRPESRDVLKSSPPISTCKKLSRREAGTDRSSEAQVAHQASRASGLRVSVPGTSDPRSGAPVRGLPGSSPRAQALPVLQERRGYIIMGQDTEAPNTPDAGLVAGVEERTSSESAPSPDRPCRPGSAAAGGVPPSRAVRRKAGLVSRSGHR
jgi:sarcosine oxidase subunit alpha